MTQEEYETKKSALIAEIEAAFDGVEREDGITLHEADVIDDYGNVAAREAARLKDTELRWQDVPDEDIKWGYLTLFYLDAKGFHYYFPAYLVWDLRFADVDGFESDTFETIHSKLRPFVNANVDKSFIETFSLFNNEQKKTIAHYLQFHLERRDFMTEHENVGSMMDYEHKNKNIQWALDIYWSQFL